MTDLKRISRQYQSMLRIRLVEESIVNLYPLKRMRCPVHLSIGQEAVAVGICGSLTRSDLCVSTHRGHAHYLAKQGDLTAFLHELHGLESGCSGGGGGSMHLTDLSAGFFASTAIVGNSCPLGVGLGLSIAQKSGREIVVIFIGDGSMEEGAVLESLNFAAAFELPILFCCENNQFSVYTHLHSRQPQSRKLHELARAMNLQDFYCDGSQIMSCDEMCLSAIDYVRSTRKPAFIEFQTFRHREHCGVNYDDDLGYRDAKYIEMCANGCPINLCKNYLIANGLQELEKKILDDAVDEVLEAWRTIPGYSDGDLVHMAEALRISV